MNDMLSRRFARFALVMAAFALLAAPAVMAQDAGTGTTETGTTTTGTTDTGTTTTGTTDTGTTTTTTTDTTTVPPAPPPEPVKPTEPGKDYVPVEGLENWRYDYDVSSFKPGKYNILVRATDAAGNVTFSTPFNIVIDPASDLPITRIAHPLANMRVGADLNVVGTCVDDDAVAAVEVKLDDGEWVKAEGADYWSYYLQTADLADGLHVLYSRGVVVYGAVGNPVGTPFHLDRTKPLHQISTPAFGTLVSGRLSLTGTVYDANSVAKAFYSTDSGVTWLPLKFALDKKTNIATFALAVDTTRIDDGPAVVWFKSVDGVGSEGVAVFLYFVDNTKPELEILSPVEGEPVNGRFTVVGRVYDKVGIASMSWQYGSQTGIIELLPGNPFFSLAFDAPAGGKATIRFTTTDVTGNVVIADLNRNVDPKTDLPIVTLTSPAPDAALEGVPFVTGGARDDDGVATVVWKVDGGPETAIVTDGAFSFPLAGLASGRRVVSVKAVDVNGLSGPWVELPMTYSAAAPELAFTTLVDAAGERPFQGGITVSTMEGKAVVHGVMVAGNPVVDLSYSINGNEAVKLVPGKSPGESAFTIPLPASLPYGVLDLSVTATDSFGRTGSVRAPLYAVNYAKVRVGPLLDFGAVPEDGLAIVRPGAPFVGIFLTPYPGEAAVEVRLDPPSSLVGAVVDGSFVRVEYVAEGLTPPTMVIVKTERGHVFEAGPFSFRTDTKPPAVTIATPAFGDWVSGIVDITGTAEDGSAIGQVEFSLDGVEYEPLEVKGSAFSGQAVVGITSGPVYLRVRATDANGNVSEAYTAFMVDSTAPAPARLLPRAGSPAGGIALYAVSPGEPAQGVASITLVENGSERSLDYATVVSFQADGSSGELLLRIADKAGNVTELDLLEGLDAAAPPELPAELAYLKNNVEAESFDGSGAKWTGTDAVGAVSWASPLVDRADTTAFPEAASRPIRVSGIATLAASFTGVTLDPKTPQAFWSFTPDSIVQPLAVKFNKTTNAYEVVLKLPVQPDGRATLWVLLRDITAGERFAKVELEYDSTPPAVVVVAPQGAVPGPFVLAVDSSDANGIRELQYEAGAEKGVLETLPGSGAAVRPFSFAAKATSIVVTVKAVDGSGNVGKATATITYDAAGDLPRASIVTPLDGAKRTDDSPIYVYAADDDAVASVSLSIDARAIVAEGQGPLFALEPGALAFGKRVATLTATDSSALTSAKAVATFTRVGEAPTVAVDSIQRGKELPEPITHGSAVVIDAATVLPGTVFSSNGLAALSYRVNGGEWIKAALPAKPNADGTWPIAIPLAATLPFDRVSVTIRAEDPLGMSGEKSVLLYRVAPAPAAGISDGEAIYVADARLGEDGTMLLRTGDAVGALWNGRPLAEAFLDPPVPFMNVAFEPGNSVVTITASGEGMAGSSVLRIVTVDGDRAESTPFVFVVDDAPPTLALTGPAASAWLRDSLPARGWTADANGIDVAEWSLDGGLTWTAFSAADPAEVAAAMAEAAAAATPAEPAVEAAAEGTAEATAEGATETTAEASTETTAEGSTETPAAPVAEPIPAGAFHFNEPLALSTADGAFVDGSATLFVRVRDKAGRQSEAALSYWKDNLAPVPVIVSPRKGDLVNGTVLVSGWFTDAGDVATLEYAPDGTTFGPLEFAPAGATALTADDGSMPAGARSIFGLRIDLAALANGPEAAAFRITDKAGNATVYAPLAGEDPAFAVDIVADKPTVQVQIPFENDVIRADFVVSGMAFDDDGIKEIFWRMDGGEWNRLEGANGFSVPFKLLETLDNEHTFEAYALDLNGVQGDTASRMFRVSREEPVGQLVFPDVSITNRGLVDLKGVASDANGVREVWISFDNGNTYNKAVGTTDWTYRLDTRVLQDGVHSVYVKLFDDYDTSGFAAGLISVDNAPPSIVLSVPGDGDEYVGFFTIGGRLDDLVIVEKVLLEITAIGSDEILRTVELPTTDVFSRVVPLDGLPAGWYNLKVTASDRALNSSWESKNIQVMEDVRGDVAEIIFPAHGEFISGSFTLDCRITSAKPPATASIMLNDQLFAEVPVNKQGWFSIPVKPDMVEDGELVFRVDAVSAAGKPYSSEPRTVHYTREGPWVDVDEFVTGDFIIGRPFVVGKAGWDVPVADKADKDAWAAYQLLLRDRKPVKVEISRDNGRTFEEADGTVPFKFKLQTQEYPNGELRLIVRATFANGQTAIRKRIFTVDTRPPTITIVRPAENGRFNGVIAIEGTAGDDSGLSEVALVVRSGDKASYEVPSFIQGSYVDMHLMGATRVEAGFGLSFFDDNVRLQVQAGSGFDAQPSWENLFGIADENTPAAELSRFGGYVLGAKLLASVAYLPFSFLFGPDWDFFSMSFAVGATFTYFSQQRELGLIFSPPDNKYMVLSSVIVQWEFAKFALKIPVLTSIGLYWEGGLVFIPSEASTTLEEFIRPNFALGVRFGLF